MKDKWYKVVTPKPNNNSLADQFLHNWRCKCEECEATWQDLKANNELLKYNRTYEQ